MVALPFSFYHGLFLVGKALTLVPPCRVTHGNHLAEETRTNMSSTEVSGYFWDTFEILLGYFWDTFEILLRYFWDIFLTLLGTFFFLLLSTWGYLGVFGELLNTSGYIGIF